MKNCCKKCRPLVNLYGNTIIQKNSQVQVHKIVEVVWFSLDFIYLYIYINIPTFLETIAPIVLQLDEFLWYIPLDRFYYKKAKNHNFPPKVNLNKYRHR